MLPPLKHLLNILIIPVNTITPISNQPSRSIRKKVVYFFFVCLFSVIIVYGVATALWQQAISRKNSAEKSQAPKRLYPELPINPLTSATFTSLHRNPFLDIELFSNQRHVSDFLAENLDLVPFQRVETAEAVITHRMNIHKNEITAVLIVWKRMKNVKFIVNYLCGFRYTTEIIIWNNNPNLQLKLSDFPPTMKNILIVNSKYNYGVKARYIAAMMASNPTIFFQDDDYDVRKYYYALYEAFLSNPSMVHTVTDLWQMGYNWEHSYYDSKLNLHTGFAFIGCGCFVSKVLIERLFIVFTKYNGGPKAEMHFDCIFTLLTNQIPMVYQVVLNNIGTKADRAVAILRRNDTKEEIKHLIDFARDTVVEKLLQQQRPNISAANESDLALTGFLNAKMGFQRFWTICLNDSCLFETDVNTIDVFNLQYDPAEHTDGRDRRKQLKTEIRHLKTNPYLCAVNAMKDCCWKSRVPVRPGNYFGYDFLVIDELGQLCIDHRMANDWLTMVVVEASLDGSTWKELRKDQFESKEIHETNHTKTILDFRPKHIHSSVVSRLLRFRFLYLSNRDHYLSLCGLLRV